MHCLFPAAFLVGLYLVRISSPRIELRCICSAVSGAPVPGSLPTSAGRLTPHESFRVAFDTVRLPIVDLALFCRLLPGASSSPRAAASRVINQRMSIGAVITTPSSRSSSER
jgi:hypothetical protein